MQICTFVRQLYLYIELEIDAALRDFKEEAQLAIEQLLPAKSEEKWNLQPIYLLKGKRKYYSKNVYLAYFRITQIIFVSNSKIYSEHLTILMLKNYINLNN